MSDDDLAVTLVLRLERQAVPSRVDALEAAAIAMLSLEARRGTEPEAEPAWRVWEASPRKLVRRARAGQWAAAEAHAAVHVRWRTAEVLGFGPQRVDETPPFLRRLQVEGTDLPNTTAIFEAPRHGGPVVWLNPDVAMTAGKTMAQVGHAAAQLWAALAPSEQAQWAADTFPISVRTASPEHWRGVQGRGSLLVRDGGLTEIPRGTITAAGEWTTG